MSHSPFVIAKEDRTRSQLPDRVQASFARPRCVQLMAAALRLHAYLTGRHWDGHALTGPDVGVRLNYRIGRFVKSYVPFVRWNDDYFYVQAQGYWILGNWRLYSITGDEKYREIALRCSECVLKRQRDDGAWVYPNPEWRGRIATAEGTWGAIGLLESYRQTSSARFLQGACMWADFVTREIGFQRAGDTLAVNYFHGRRGARVPNNSAFVARFFAELADVTGRKHSLGPCAGLVEFLRAVQNDAGEFPYTVPGENGEKPTPHFQCYQYNAFQCLDLMRYHDVTKDRSVLPLVVRVLGFLRMGLASDGHSYFACGSRSRTVTYHTAVLAKAFARAEELNILNDDELADRAYSYLVNVQQPDGSFPFSRGDYLLLRDTRSYPRNLAMILYHLLPGECGGA